VKTRKTCQAALVEVLAQKKSKINTLEGPHHDQADQCQRAGFAPLQSPGRLPDALRHLASWTEAKIDQDLTTRVGGDWIDDHRYRDTIGLINWEAITAITWRWTE
jgi:hypothetical protein